MLSKIIVVALLIGVIASLFSAGNFLVQDKGKSNRTVNALKWRLIIASTLLIFLAIGYFTGIVEIGSPWHGQYR